MHTIMELIMLQLWGVIHVHASPLSPLPPPPPPLPFPPLPFPLPSLFPVAYIDSFGEKDSRYERLMEMYTQEAMTQQKWVV